MTRAEKTDRPLTPALQRILDALRRKSNMSISDIAAEAFVGTTTLACGGYIRTLRSMRLIYVSGWRKTKGRFVTPLFSPGCEPDVARPRIDATTRDAPGMGKILEALERRGGLTYHEIASYSGLSPNTVKNSGYLNALIAQNRIHIANWRRARNGPMCPVYVLGSGDNVARPDTLTSAHKSRRFREKQQVLAPENRFGLEIKALIRIAQGL